MHNVTHRTAPVNSAEGFRIQERSSGTGIRISCICDCYPRRRWQHNNSLGEPGSRFKNAAISARQAIRSSNARIAIATLAAVRERFVSHKHQSPTEYVCGRLQPTVRIASEPLIACPSNVRPLSEADISPHGTIHRYRDKDIVYMQLPIVVDDGATIRLANQVHGSRTLRLRRDRQLVHPRRALRSLLSLRLGSADGKRSELHQVEG
jgi:hypothetical protein